MLKVVAFFFFTQTLFADVTDRSIYKVDPLIDGSIMVVSALGVLVPYSSNLITYRCPCDANEVNGFDRPVIGKRSQAAMVASDITMVATIAIPAVFDFFDLGASCVFLEDATVFTEALLVSGALVTLTKHIVQRPVPRTYEGDPEYLNSPEGYRSFFSGHTVTAFTALSAFSMTLHYRYRLGVWPWVATALVGSSVALERVAAGVHFYSDVMVGAAVGTAVGILVPWLHEKKTLDGTVVIAPTQGGLQLVWMKTF